MTKPTPNPEAAGYVDCERLNTPEEEAEIERHLNPPVSKEKSNLVETAPAERGEEERQLLEALSHANESSRVHVAEIVELRAHLTAKNTELSRLRAALEKIEKDTREWSGTGQAEKLGKIAREALKEKK